MKKTALLISLLIATLTNAQNKPSPIVYGMPLDTIANMVRQHPKYFDHLLRKASVLENKISQDELILLYYGSAFMKNYKPKDEEKAVNQIAQTMASLDFTGAITEGKNYLKVYPANARLYMLVAYAYKKIGKKSLSKVYYKRYADLLRIPLYSGTGKDFEQAFVVRNTSDEYLILNNKDLDLAQQELRYHNQLPYDVMLVSPKNTSRQKQSAKEKLYFNIYLPFFIGEGHSYKEMQENAKRKYHYKPNTAVYKKKR